MRSVIAYTDGCCLGNPGAGGWGSLMQYDGAVKEIFGGEVETTNNRMEMMAVIRTLENLIEPSSIQIHTDSQYVKNGMTSWLMKWKANGWRTSDKKPVKNKDLWERLDELCGFHSVSFHWVRGHNGHPENERADALANMGAQAYV